jgi:uncharacterized repeat protein (TIGR03803 family)
MPLSSQSTKATLALTLFAACALFMTAFTTTQARAQTETILHNFMGQPDGQFGYAPPIFDSLGNLYCTTSGGGSHGGGTVFKLTPNGSGGWTETILYSIGGSSDSPSEPWGGLTFDSAGNLYGTTYYGGENGYGTVFQLKPSNGHWFIKVLHSFNNNGEDGFYPQSGVVLDSAGNLYGTTSEGGAENGGIVYELVLSSTGQYRERILHGFANPVNQVGNSSQPLTFDSAGNLYGVSMVGGKDDFGVAFELTPQTGGSWKYKVLWGFGGVSGTYPKSNLLVDSAGNLYGTANSGDNGFGTLYELSPTASGPWTEKSLAAFNTFGYAEYPTGNIAFDAEGNIYGTSFDGGPGNVGTVWEASPAGNEAWTLTVLHNFGSGTDGAYPVGGVALDSSGNVYGTTATGGTAGFGTTWEVTP